MSIISSLVRRFKEYKRVINISRKPSKQEFASILKVSSLGVALMGFIGFIIQLIYQFIIGVFV